MHAENTKINVCINSAFQIPFQTKVLDFWITKLFYCDIDLKSCDSITPRLFAVGLHRSKRVGVTKFYEINLTLANSLSIIGTNTLKQMGFMKNLYGYINRFFSCNYRMCVREHLLSVCLESCSYGWAKRDGSNHLPYFVGKLCLWDPSEDQNFSFTLLVFIS